MPTHESLLGPAEAVFFQHMDALSKSGDQQLHDMSQRGIDQIRSGTEYRLTLVPNHSFGIDIDTATSLELVEVSLNDQPLHGVVLVVDIDKMMFQPALEFQGDLLRTLAIVDQFPDHGYERKLTEVYGDALNLQAKWLDEHNVGKVDHDPRYVEREELLRQLLGDAYYYNDVSFADYQEAVDFYMFQEKRPAMITVLGSIRGNLGHFESAREKFIPLAHKTLLEKGGPYYHKLLSADLRTKGAAQFLAGLIYVSGRQ